MWGYQQHFKISIETTAKSLFSKIDPRLSPNVFLLGILTEKRNDRHPVCLEPEDCGFDVNDFTDIHSLATELEKVDEERQIFHSHPLAQENHEKRIGAKSYVHAISKILKRQDLYGVYERFISYPTYVEGYQVFVILALQKDVIEQHYSLSKNVIDNRFTIQRSLIESAINVYLIGCGNALKNPDTSFDAIGRPADELIRDAGKKFMYTVSQVGKNFEGLHGLYDACNEIASMRYEGEIGLGAMLIADQNHPNIRITLQLKEPIRINNYRKVRKFLEAF